MDLKIFTAILGHTSSVVLVIGLLLGAVLYKKLSSLHKSILYYLVLMFCIDAASYVLIKLYRNNLIIMHVFSLTELLFFVYFYNRQLLPKPKPLLLGIGALGAFYIIAEFINYFVIGNFSVKYFQPYAKVADNFVVIIMSLYFFYEKANGYPHNKLANVKLNTVILLFFTLNAIMFLPFNFFINEQSGVQFYVWNINVCIIIAFYVYLIGLIWQEGNRRK